MKIGGMVGKTDSRDHPIVRDYLNSRASKGAKKVFDLLNLVKEAPGAQMIIISEEINELRIGNEQMLDIRTMIRGNMEGQFASMKIYF